MVVNEPTIIVLLGYMGSGKTTVGQQLATSMGWEHLDLDVFIEAQEKMSIAQIIHQKGVIYFRKVEHNCLKSVLQTSKKVILSLGGGTPCYYNSMELLRDTAQSISFYLRANVPFLTARLFPEKSHRPLIASIETQNDLAEFIGKHLFERASFYDKADYSLGIERKTPTQLAQEIMELVQTNAIS